MEKKTIKITEKELTNVISNVITESLGEGALHLKRVSNMEYNQIESLNEMAQINLKEVGAEKQGKFDCSRYYVYVKGEGGYRKFPHYHIKHKTEGWDIRMNIDGTYHSYKNRSQKRQTDQDFKDIEKISIQWAKMPNVFEPDKTNGKVAEIEWYRNNS